MSELMPAEKQLVNEDHFDPTAFRVPEGPRHDSGSRTLGLGLGGKHSPKAIEAGGQHQLDASDSPETKVENAA